MSFDYLDIRRAMDVYTLDNVHLGMVLSLDSGPPDPARGQAPDVARQPSQLHGEALGPVPTEALGNAGPRAQSAGTGYGVAPDDTPVIGRDTLTVGKWWGLRGRRTIPLDAVQTVSLERVVLRLKREQLPR